MTTYHSSLSVFMTDNLPSGMKKHRERTEPENINGNAVCVKALHVIVCMSMLLTSCDHHIRHGSLCSWLYNTCVHARELYSG